MNQNLHSPTKLTEFARDFDDEPETLFGRFVYKIQNVYNQSYNTVNDLPSTSSSSSNNNNTPTTNVSKIVVDSANKQSPSISQSSSSSSMSNALKQQPPTTLPIETSEPTTPPTTVTNEEQTEARTMVNVLKRISNLMASKNNDLRNYKDTDLHKFWMPDSKAKECYDCTQRFNTFRRKHHCRLCGQIFCSKCCNQVVPGKIILCAGDLKVCNYCSKIVLSYLKSPNITKDLQSDLQALQQDLTSKLEEVESNITVPVDFSPRKMSLGYQEERFATPHAVNNLSEMDRKSILQQSNSLITLQQEMRQALPAQNCGLELIEFLNEHNKCANKMQAIAILSAMLAAGFIQPIVPDSEEMDFDENLHYKFQNISKQNASKFPDLTQTPVKQFNVSANEPQPPKSIEQVSLSLQSTQEAELENSMRSTTTTSKLLEAYCDHEEQLLTQMLHFYQLDLRWSKVLLPLCCRAANHFKPEYCTNDLMDIRNYVNFKKVPGGKRQECTIVGGVVFSKNVAHKDMAARVEMPRVLLLQCAIVYERIEGKFVSISTVLLQEKEYLRNVCKRIMSFQPNVVLVHKNVAGVAQDILRSQGVTLVLDVKLSVLERLARTLQCDILSSIESNISKPRLGLCDAFYIQSFNDGSGSSKTLMFFEKLNSPRGYTCLLRGSHNAELKKVKKVAAFMVYARYNWRLEMSLLLDEFAQAQQPSGVVFDNSEQTGQLLRQNKRSMSLKAEKRDLENVPFNMDPLRNEAAVLPAVTEHMELEVETRYDNRFRNALSSTILSVSPFVVFPLPYLETEQGRKCALRKLFPKELYYSKQWSSLERTDATVEINNNNNNSNKQANAHLNAAHEFLTLKITKPSDDRHIQTLLAEFRAMGCRYRKCNELFKIQANAQQEVHTQKASDEHIYKDALDLENHQRLPVLFCSFYFNQKTGSSFCAPPTLLDMKFYGHQDIMLGQFLQRYCCRLSSICTLCNLPMLNHVRRYVHAMGCVQVFLSEDSMKTDPNRIFFTAWCSICNEVTPSVALSETSKCLSLAKYLELRFHAHSYKKRALAEEQSSAQCQHSLQRDYVHYFSFRGVGAKFQYTNIEVWEISLPALNLQLQQPKIVQQFQLLEDVKNFSTKGHEIFTRIHERIADLAIDDENSPLLANLKQNFSKDQLHFKRHVEDIQTIITDSNASAYQVNDAMLMAKRNLAESLEVWTPRLQEIAAAQKQALKQQHQPQAVAEPPAEASEDSTGVTTEGEDSNDDAASTGGVSNTNADKKSIKQIISQLLPSAAPAISLQSPYSKEEHYNLPLGAFPVLVHDHDLSSVIAYSLLSQDYQRALNNLTQSNVVEKEIAVDASVQEIEHEIKEEVLGGKSLNNNNNGTPSQLSLAGGSEESKLKSHIDIAFQDNQTHFSCRIYFAKEFDLLRSKILHPCESGKEDAKLSNIEASRYALARSLCSSVQWEARGGKSGSRFCKTLDDRFVLKEMSKGDVQIFDSFAPNYFEYIAKSQQQNEPTLLAKIFGVFKVSIKKKDFVQEKSLLVMENLFYNLDIKNKFDLKGSERNRLVNPTEQDGETVLLDENLVQMSWSKPLYILSHSKVVLKNAITRDSTFLEKNKVMDYSLLVGLDHDHNTLVLGIIDYIRTYTLEKKFESFVKQTGILGGGVGKLPTIISPERYKLRFIDAMDRYFYTVPDRWEGLSKS